MSLVDWYEKHVKNGKGWNEAAYQLYLGGWRRFGRIHNYGEPIWNREWEVLLVLDACRYDLMKEIESEYGFITTVERTNSAASTSSEWMKKNFHDTYRENTQSTGYVTGNPFSEEEIDSGDFHTLDEVWKYGWDDNAGTIQPDTLTDRAIYNWQEERPERMIVHYMQPHFPFVQDPLSNGIVEFGKTEKDAWTLVRQENIDYNDVWGRYCDNLRYVLDSVEVLLKSIDADEVVITSDHGNFIGEYGLYGHPQYIPLPPVKAIPWVQTEATKVQEYTPTVTKNKDNEYDVEENLQDLGYL